MSCDCGWIVITVAFASKQNKTKTRGSGFFWITTIHFNNSFNQN